MPSAQHFQSTDSRRDAQLAPGSFGVFLVVRVSHWSPSPLRRSILGRQYPASRIVNRYMSWQVVATGIDILCKFKWLFLKRDWSFVLMGHLRY
jgi:hypothetical protein